MRKAYQSMFSINIEKYFFEEEQHPRGCYIPETGHGIVFLAGIRDTIVEACGGFVVVCGEMFFNTKPSDEDEDKKRQRKYKRLLAGHRQVEGEQDVLKNIIKLDLHEFIHHFLTVNEIPNNCCDEQSHTRDWENGVFGKCWLCDFTQKLCVNVAPTKNNQQHPELLTYMGRKS